MRYSGLFSLCLKSFIILFSIFLFHSSFDYAAADPYQGVHTPASMYTENAFFTPQIRVCETVEKGKCKNFNMEDCKYVFPTFVKAYGKSDGNTGENPSICACQTFTCDPTIARIAIIVGSALVPALIPIAIGPALATGLSYAGDLKACTKQLGCIKVPIAPGPPPFCSNLSSSPEVNLVPVERAQQDILHPKIKIIVGSQVKLCDNGSYIPIDASCTDGSKGVESGFTTKIITATPNDVLGPEVAVLHSGINYYFRAYTIEQGSKVCANYYGDSTVNGNGRSISLGSKCYNVIDMGAPIISLSPNDSNVLNVAIPDCTPNSTTSCNLSLVAGAPPMKFASVSAYAFHPKIDEDRKMIFGLKCSGGANPTKQQDLYQCPAGQDIYAGYQSNSSNNDIICLGGFLDTKRRHVLFRRENPDDQNSKLHYYYISSHKQAMLPMALLNYGGDKGMQGVHCTGGVQYDLNTTKQNILDTFRDYSLAKGYMIIEASKNYNSKTTSPLSLDPCRSNKLVFTYDTPKSYKKYTSPPKDYKYEEAVTNVGTEYIVNTNYYDSYTLEPFFLKSIEVTDAEMKKLQFLDPYMGKLCIDNFDKTSFTQVGSSFIYDTTVVKQNTNKTCQFFTISAWGGGQAGSRTNPYRAGAAGAYAVLTIKNSQDITKLKIDVGKGGDAEREPGSASKVQLCKNVTTTNGTAEECKTIIDAHGGGDSNPNTNTPIITSEDFAKPLFPNSHPSITPSIVETQLLRIAFISPEGSYKTNTLHSPQVGCQSKINNNLMITDELYASLEEYRTPKNPNRTEDTTLYDTMSGPIRGAPYSPSAEEDIRTENFLNNSPKNGKNVIPISKVPKSGMHNLNKLSNLNTPPQLNREQTLDPETPINQYQPIILDPKTASQQNIKTINQTIDNSQEPENTQDPVEQIAPMNPPDNTPPVDQIKENIEKEEREKNTVYPGAGGCVDIDNNRYQEGANGRVDVVCETWRP